MLSFAEWGFPDKLPLTVAAPGAPLVTGATEGMAGVDGTDGYRLATKLLAGVEL